MKISPKEFVELLDKKVIGQENAKKMLAIALRNRWRRMQLDSKVRKEITPKNILMIGPTGVGKTAIIRAMADIVDAPMIKVEATKYTQIGYIGATVEEMIQQLAQEAHRKLNKGNKSDSSKSNRINYWNNPKSNAANPFEDLMKNLFSDLKPLSIIQLPAEKHYDKNQLKTYSAKIKHIIGKDVYPIAKKYGYSGEEKDLFLIEKGLFSLKQIDQFAVDSVTEGFIVDCPFKMPQLTLLSFGCLPHSLNRDKQLEHDIKQVKSWELIDIYRSFIANPNIETIDEFNRTYMEKFSKHVDSDEETAEATNFSNYAENIISKLKEKAFRIDNQRFDKFNRELNSIIKTEMFKLSQVGGYTGTQSSVMANSTGFYRSNDFYKYIEKNPKDTNLYTFAGTFDSYLAKIGLVPKKSLSGLRGNVRKNTEEIFSKAIKEGFEKSKILVAMYEYTTHEVENLPQRLALDEFFDLTKDIFSKSLRPYLKFAKWKILRGDYRGFSTINRMNSRPEAEISKSIASTVAKERSVVDYIHEKGIIFIDEIDKLAVGKGEQGRDNIGKIGVQRDLLALLDGTEIETNYGTIKTENIMFITAGAFHSNEVNDLMPELLGRLPIHVKLEPMNEDMLERVLKDSENSPITQHKLLLKTEGVNVIVTDEAIEEIASLSNTINNKYRNMGARTLHAVIERVFSEVSFDAYKDLEDTDKDLIDFSIDKDYVRKIRKDMLKEFNDEYYKRIFKQMSEKNLY